MKIYQLIKNKCEIIFFLILFYGLSISILLKELNLIFFINTDLNFLILYRISIILVSLVLFFFIKKKIEKKIFILIFVCLIFIFNSLLKAKLNFSIDGIDFFREINTFLDQHDNFFSNKSKIITINFFNIIIPLFLIGFISFKKFDFSSFYLLSFKICKIYFYCLILFIGYKYYLFFESDIEIKSLRGIESYFINIHSMLFLFNIYFFLIVDKIYRNQNLKFEYFFNIILIFLSFYILNSFLHIFICIFTLLTYLFIFKKNSKFIYFISIIFILFVLLIIFSIFNYSYFLNLSYESGTFLNSIFIRVKTIEYFLLYSTNLNFIIGNNIFSDQIALYPHNLIIDLIVCSGLIGLIIYSYFIIRILKNLKFFTSDKLLLIFIFFQSLMLSLFSGFLFTNIIFNIALAICFCLVTEKDEKITKNSLG